MASKELKAIIFFLQAWSVLVGVTAIVVAALLDELFQFETVRLSLSWLLVGSGLAFFVVGYLILLLNLVRLLCRGVRGWLCLNENRAPAMR